VALTIGKIASAVNVSTDTLRYYEREGLIGPASKSRGGYRLYDRDAVRRVRSIKQAQNCGFTLTEIRALLALRGNDAACCHDVRPRRLGEKAAVGGEDQGDAGHVEGARSPNRHMQH
jgi:DNA-binding transcriptional MerR regulator